MAKVAFIDKKKDIAILNISLESDRSCIPIAKINDEYPSVGDQVTVYGNHRLGAGNIQPTTISEITNSHIAISGNSVPGHSGSGIVYQGKVIGIITAQAHQLREVFPGRWKRSTPPHGVGVSIQVLNRLLKGRHPHKKKDTDHNVPEPPKQEVVQNTVHDHPELKALIKGIEASILSEIAKFQSCKCAPSPTVEDIADEFWKKYKDELTVDIDYEKIISDVKDQIDIPSVTHDEKYVLVRNTHASNWVRTEQFLRDAREAFTPIDEVSPEEIDYSGPLPVLVYYRDGTPVETWQGQKKVNDQLTLVSRN